MAADRATTDFQEATGRDGAIDHLAKGAMQPSAGRHIYTSPSGDTWYLVRDAFGVSVIHTGNLASGGHVERLYIPEFLKAGNGPEHQELLRLIGTLAG